MRGSAEVQRVHDAFKQTNGDTFKVEASFNFIEVGELFLVDTDDVGAEALDDLTRSLCESWKARLERSFPDKRFIVEFVPRNNETGEEVGLQFYQSSAS